MASSISPLSYLDPTWQSLAPSSSSNAPVSATTELQALQKQGDFQEFFNDSMAAALLQPASGIDSGTAPATLVNNMLQQVLGAYQEQSPGTSTGKSISG